MLYDLFCPILGEDQISQTPEDRDHFGKDWCHKFEAAPGIVLFPSCTEEVQKIVKVCNQHNLSIVPSGGRTGLSGGATATNGEVVLSTHRLNKVLSVDSQARTIRVQAGVNTERVQQEAEEAGLFFPVDFASKGSSQIGGNIATNAGGVRVLRYGCFRQWVLSLQFVSSEGNLHTANGELHKNQTGYDLRSLIIGSEGTLGIVTEATLLLTVPPQSIQRAFVAIPTPSDALSILRELQSNRFKVSMCEFLPDLALKKVLRAYGKKTPLQGSYEYYLLLEIEADLKIEEERFQEVLMSLLERDQILDAVVSNSQSQANELLLLREGISETLSGETTVHKHDIAIPLQKLGEFFAELQKLNFHHCEQVTYGHIGDGNLHVNTLKPKDMPREEFYRSMSLVDKELYSLVHQYSGSISAEHGVGLLKKDYLHLSRSVEDIALFKAIKYAFDPKGILNPGKIF